MNVQLVAVTQPLVKTEDKTRYLSPEEFITYCARVSNPTNQLNVATASRLLKYCIEHKHWSIFEQVSCTFEIKTSRAIAAQILRHRSFSFQEFSQRYSIATSLENIEWRLQGKTNRQVGDEATELNTLLECKVQQAQRLALEAYDDLIEKGVAKECARMILPLNTSTTLYMSGTIRSWIHYIDLRAKEDTQKEHRDIACGVRDIFVQKFPTVSSALNWS
jgi:thymidylate synthase (FAD)